MVVHSSYLFCLYYSFKGENVFGMIMNQRKMRSDSGRFGRKKIVCAPEQLVITV